MSYYFEVSQSPPSANGSFCGHDVQADDAEEAVLEYCKRVLDTCDGYPDGDVFYVKSPEGEISEFRVTTDFEPTYYASPVKAGPLQRHQICVR